MKASAIKIYTDGSCHTKLLIGAWAAILFIGDEKIVLKGAEINTTHNRMELTGIINAIDYVNANGYGHMLMEVFSDSQYAVNLLTRKDRLKKNNFITKKGTPIQNVDLVQALIKQMETYQLHFNKVKAHQKGGDVINREVDIIVRQVVRKAVLNS